MKRALQRLLRVVAFLVLAIAALGIAAYLLRGPLFSRLLAERIERELAARLGGRFSVAKVEGSYFSDFALVGLRTEEPPPGVLRRLDCGRAVVEFDLGRLIDGDLGAITSVLLSNAAVEVDLTREGGAPGAVELPRLLPRLELYGRAAVMTEFGEVRAEGLSINTIGRERLGIRATELRLPERFGPGAPFAGTVARTGPLAFVLTSETPVAGVTPARVSWEGALDARLLVGGSVAEVRVAGGETRFSAAALDLASLPAWAYPAGIEPAQGVAAVEGRASSLLPLAFEFAARAERVRWRDLDLSDAYIDVRYADGATLVRAAHAQGPGFLVDAKEVVFDPALPWLFGDVGEATVHVADLRTFVPELDRPLAFSATARRKGGRGFEVASARVEGEGILVEGKGEVVPPDDVARWREAAVSGTYTGAVRDFAAGGRGFAGAVRLSGAVSGTLAAPEATAVAEGEDLVVEGMALDLVRAEARVTARVLRVEALRVEAAAGTLRARAAVDLEARAIEDGSYEVDVVDLAAFLGLFPGAPAAQGTFSARGTFAADRAGVRGTAEVTASGLVAQGRELGDLSMRARAEGSEITIEFAEARGAWGAASGRGVVHRDEGRATVEALDVDAGSVRVTLGRAFPVTWAGGDARTGPLDFAALGGRVQGTAALKGGERLEAALRVEGIDLSLLDRRLAGRAAGTLAIDGERFEADLTIPAAAYEGRAADVRVKAHSGFDGITVQQLLVRAGENVTVEGTATLPWRFDGRSFERVETVKPALAIEARLQGITHLGARVGNSVVSVRGDEGGLRAEVRLHDLSVDGFPVRGSTIVAVTATKGRVEASAVLERGDLGEAEAKASTDKGFDWTNPDDVRAAFDTARIDAEVKLRAPDLAVFRRLVPGLAELSGTADGSIRFGGPLRAPSAEGQLYVAGLEARVEGDVPRLTECTAELRVEGRTVRIVACAGELGHAPVGAGGTIDLDGAVLDLRLTGKNALLLADPRLRVRADFDLTVQGEPAALRIGGKVVITDALYTRATKLLASGKRNVRDATGRLSVRRAPLSTAALDLEVTADETIRMRAPDLRGDLSCDLRIRGTGEVPAPEGRIFFRDLLVEANPIASIKVDRGEISFPPGEPFDPRLDIAAHTKLKGYEIEVDVLGRADDAELRVSSRPPLPQDDAILLLATGYTREDLDREGIPLAAFEQLAGLVGKRLIAKLSGPTDPDERTFLDRFQFRVGKEVSRSGDDTIEAEFEASKKLFLRIERDRFDEYNGGIVWRIRFR